MKKQSFVCYARITPGGVQRVLYKAAITPGDDAISKNDATLRTAAFIGTYLTDVAESNTLFAVATALPATITAIQTTISSMIAGIQAGKRNRIKFGFTKITQGGDINKPAFVITTVINGVKNTVTLPLTA